MESSTSPAAPAETLAADSGFTLVEEDDVAFTLSLCREIHRLYGDYQDGELPASESVRAALFLTLETLAMLSARVTVGMPSMRVVVAAAQAREMLAVVFGRDPMTEDVGIRSSGQYRLLVRQAVQGVTRSQPALPPRSEAGSETESAAPQKHGAGTPESGTVIGEVTTTNHDVPPPDTPRPDTPRPDTPRPDTPRPDTARPDTARPELVAAHRHGAEQSRQATGSAPPATVSSERGHGRVHAGLGTLLLRSVRSWSAARARRF